MTRGVIGGWFLKVAVVAAFVGAVAALSLLVQSSGILSRPKATDSARFTDVPLDHPQRQAIERAAELGLVTPTTKDVFGVMNQVTRAEFAAGIVKALEWPVDSSEAEPFTDVQGRADRTDLADYVAVVYRKGVMSGPATTPPEFQPNQPVLLAHVIIVAVRAAGAKLKEPTIPNESIAALDISDGLKSALQAAVHGGLLADAGIDPVKADLFVPVRKAEAAVILMNLRRIVGKE
ncbi:MAG: hypothetical protein Kow00122_11760 [Thermoleophilia bacterium]